LETKPDEIYNLAGQTSVGLSFAQPIEAIDSIANATINWLEAIRLFNKKIKFFNAGSSEMFGETVENPACELSRFSPKSPYAIAKTTAYWYVKSYRESYGLKCCTGIMSNHESPLRGDSFVTQKIIKSIQAIKKNEINGLNIGNIDISRDWGWAPDYVEAMHLLLNKNPTFDDFIIASGKTHSLKEFIHAVFKYYELDCKKYIRIDSSLFRPNDLSFSSLNPAKIKSELKWTSSHPFEIIVQKLCSGQLY